MAFQPAPNTLQMETRCTQGGFPVEWVSHFEIPGVPTQSDCDDLAAIGDTWMDADMLPALSNTVLYLETYVRSLHTSAAPEATNNTNGNSLGGNTSPALPNNVSFAIKLSTGLTGRSFRGRKFMFGLTEADVGGNDAVGGSINAWLTAWEDLFTAANGGGFTPVVLSRVQGGVTLPNAIGAPILNATIADTKVDTRRSRMS